MKANELMIGDFVTFKDCQNDEEIAVIKIWHLSQEGNTLVFIDDSKILDEIAIDDEIVGIHLTPEILEKNGFEKQQGYFGSVFAFDDDDKDTHVIIHPKENNYTRGAYTYIHVEHGCLSLDELPLEYIHELQHALKLCGIEKQIEL